MLVSCASSRYDLTHDVAPSGDFDASSVPDAVPRWEPLSPQGNYSPYTVRGVTYTLLDKAEGYVEEGIASWYGLKFHGELTSNGEIYNMYHLTAAHKTLPLPAFLKVTNLTNGQQIVVRVNDRGPFHEGRIIDLSYAAAKKLGFADAGTANVRLEAVTVTPENSDARSAQAQNVLAYFVQIAALSNQDAAKKLIDRLREEGLSGFVAKSIDKIYRVRLGPYERQTQAEEVKERLAGSGLGKPIVIKRSVAAKGS